MEETFYQKVRNYLAAGMPGIWIVTNEESSARETLIEIGQSFSTPYSVYTWTVTEGLKNPGESVGDEEWGDPYALVRNFRTKNLPKASTNGQGTIFCALDFHMLMKGTLKDDPIFLRGIKEALEICKRDGNHFVVVAPTVDLPEDWQRYFVIVDQSSPSREALQKHLWLWAVTSLYPKLYRDESERIQAFLKVLVDDLGMTAASTSNGFSVKVDGDPIKVRLEGRNLIPEVPEESDEVTKIMGFLSAGLITEPEENKILEACQGLTLEEAGRAFSLSHTRHQEVRSFEILSEKAQSFRRSGSAQFLSREALGNVGGFELAKEYMELRVNAFGPEAVEYGLTSPKGILLLGPPGTGKSLFAKAVASWFDWPLLMYDVAATKSKWVGESERALKRLFRQAEDTSPLVLLFDEIEKLIPSSAGQASSSADANMLGQLLNWMQEKTKPVYVIATANKVSDLPPELLRKGRFDEIFWVDLPHLQARMDIFNIHLSKRGRDATEMGISSLAEKSEGYTGAEIEQAIVDALFIAFGTGRVFDTALICEALDATVPLSRLAADKIESARRWAKGRTRPASAGTAVITKAGTGLMKE
jgi:SpoVK/Ycf46/Vps4 family AAA+-type ATPase